MPIWPIWWVTALGLTAWGWRLNAWHAPAIILLGLVGMRAVMWGVLPEWREITGCALWLCGAALLYRVQAWLPGTFMVLSALTYPAFLALGERIVYMGPAPIIADAFLGCALLAVFGGLWGLHSHDQYRSGSGIRDWLSHAALGVAESSGEVNRDLAPDRG